MKRNRSEGWRHAKLTGHENEDNITTLLKEDSNLQHRILKCARKEDAKIVDIIDGGLNETNVYSVFGDKTKNKTDLKIILSNDDSINISIKKSLAGQVYLITAERFISGYEKIYKQEIPSIVKRAIQLFWGEANDTREIIQKFKYQTESKIYEYQLRKNRLVANTLTLYDLKLPNELLKWFDNNMFNIIDFCFSRGLTIDEKEKAEIIWYKNTLKENDIDTILWIPQIKNDVYSKCFFGKTLGGTTIQLPFGFVQWHQGCIQFHHKYEKVNKLFNK